MIRMFNNFDSSFETFLIVKNNDARNIDKLFDFDEFITSIEQKKHRMNLININLIRVDDDKNNNRDESQNDREDERDANSNNDFTEYFCKKCYIIHQFDNENCSNKNEICDNIDCENSRDHREINCT